MTSWIVAIASCMAVLAAIPLGRLLRGKWEAKVRTEEREWREAQAAQLESVKERMNVEIDPAPMVYPELPRVRLAGLLAPPRGTRFETE
jgi:hypothetical protein